MAVTTNGNTALQTPTMVPTNLATLQLGQIQPTALAPMSVNSEDISKIKFALSQVTNLTRIK